MQRLHDDIIYIGADDDNLDLFEAQYPIPEGISYNSYLIADTCPAIVDAVDTRRCSDWLSSVSATGITPEYLIVQHVEPDHSGSVGALVARFPDIKIVCTAKAAAMLADFFADIDFTTRVRTVSEGDTLVLGRHTLRFITAPMVHWPEVMMTLDTTAGILFSADAFGTFGMYGAPTDTSWDAEARRYYTNIVGKYGAQVQAVIKKLATSAFATIAPLHGPVLTGDLTHYLHLYDLWSRYEPESDGVLVAYASVYGGTAGAARLLASELYANGAPEVVLMDLSRHDVSYAVAEAFRLGRMALCSVTYDGGLFPAMHSFLHHIKCKNLRCRRIVLVENGSWAPVAARLMAEALATMKDMTVVGKPLTLHSRLHPGDMASIRALAAEL